MRNLILGVVLAVVPVHGAVINLFHFDGYSASVGNGQPLISFAGATPAGTFAAGDLIFGDNWHPLGLSDNFGADVFANINVAAGGSYTFSTTSDDGSLLFVDGQLVVNNDYSQGATSRSGSVTLTAGTHLLEVQFFQAGGGSFLSVPLPAGVTYVDPALEPYLNIYSSPVSPTASYPAVRPGDTFVGSIPTTNLNYGTLYGGGNWFPFGVHDQFVAQMQGYFDVATSGLYTFSTSSDDGSWLVIDGAMVVDNGFFQGFTQRSGTVFLTAGRHAFDLQFFQGGGGAGLDLGVPPGVTIAALPEPGTLGFVAIALTVGYVGKRFRASKGIAGSRA
jgi:uncharacterized protein YaiE (UPF0345 family)